MNQRDPLMKIRFDGEVIGPAKIPVAHLLRFLTNLNKALQRTGRILTGEADSVHRGPQPRSIKGEVALDLVLLAQGTPISRDFWESATLDELAQAQNVQPMVDARRLFGTWPGEEDDGFEMAIDELRHPSSARGALP